ncbi:choline ABC transporter permease subunit [Phyllobacterium sp. SYP-B3895]|uniref:Choline ABC transporter permease subunit n=1 Tax=Phyllobacterium pellucidum TaxID=2740464 RepID=A0A849VQ87_9HYPH|nr:MULTISPECIES: choline ABC transporter permease subunit [Phyllobacterium]MRG56598.1 choline ABC transporter permease subunit [Phyllobacterium sp. SYP-B3895]NTS32041.1 choline ABC transporter permease subunit [Phyllobacterium pellucidum]SFJ36132.1 glycine betaine/proline transport system permease protein [Phyllobacterium sp. CL33Tsu]
MDWLTQDKIPVGRTAKQIVDWLTNNFAWFFDGLAILMQGFIDALMFVLKYPHPLIMVAIFSAIAYALRRSIGVTILTALGFLFILNQGYWQETMETLTLVLSSCILCMGIGVPIGIIAAHRPKFYAAIRPILDLMQTLPTFVYLIPAIVFFGIGMVPGLLATAIFVLPAPIRLTHLGVSSTPTHLIEAGEAFGASSRQLLWKIELPYAMPQILAGLTQTIMLSLSMVVIAALVGADGLGVPVVRALNSVNTALGFEAGLVIVVVAIVLDRIFRPGKEAGE